MNAVATRTRLVGTIGLGAVLAFCLASVLLAVSAAPAFAGWWKSGSTWYYYEGGEKQYGLQEIGNKWYLLDEDTGAMQTGWVKYDDGYGPEWYYFTSSGAAKEGWVKSGGKWYYVQGSGMMVRGHYDVGARSYYLDDNTGAMRTGWVYGINMHTATYEWMYFKSNGAAATGWQKIGGKWYYLDFDGAMFTGFWQIGGKWYYFKSSGAMATGWVKQDGFWYYFKSSGAAASGWVKSGGKWYFIYDPVESGPGVMAYNDWLIDDKDRLFYVNEKGVMVTGEYTIDDTKYLFASNGALIGTVTE